MINQFPALTARDFNAKITGFSLIELMVVAAIIGIIAAIAYPSYERSVLKSHRSDAENLIATDSQILERCYSQYFAYNTVKNGTCTPTLVTSTQYHYYTLASPAASITSNAYALRVIAVGHQTQDHDCQSFSIDQTGNKTATNSAGASNSSCWGS